jgi:hypothetical protein
VAVRSSYRKSASLSSQLYIVSEPASQSVLGDRRFKGPNVKLYFRETNYPTLLCHVLTRSKSFSYTHRRIRRWEGSRHHVNKTRKHSTRMDSHGQPWSFLSTCCAGIYYDLKVTETHVGTTCAFVCNHIVFTRLRVWHMYIFLKSSLLQIQPRKNSCCSLPTYPPSPIPILIHYFMCMCVCISVCVKHWPIYDHMQSQFVSWGNVCVPGTSANPYAVTYTCTSPQTIYMREQLKLSDLVALHNKANNMSQNGNIRKHNAIS